MEPDTFSGSERRPSDKMQLTHDGILPKERYSCGDAIANRMRHQSQVGAKWQTLYVAFVQSARDDPRSV
jgi:hypothetical protein